ncbi:hypothetical protein EC968_003334 [Mortierella alpina]|nr:hypothetical protein EC968_003334 [Mortierella alpina]
MHTQTDIAGGTVIGIAVWAVQWSFHDSIDALMTSPSWTVVAAVVFGGIVLIQSIPETMDSCPCVDDGVTTMAVLMGVFPASQHFALSEYAVSAGGHDGIVHYDPAMGLPKSIMRFVFGLAVVFTWRMAAKKLLYIALPPLYGYFNLPSRTHFVPAKTYGNLRSQPIGRVPSLLDLQALADSSIEIVGPQSTMDIHEQFSQSRSSKRTSLSGHQGIYEDIEKKEHCAIRPLHVNKAARVGKQKQPEDLQSVVSSLHQSHDSPTSEAFDTLSDDGRSRDISLDESEREAMEKFEAEHPGWARFDVDIVIKTVVYAGRQRSSVSPRHSRSPSASELSPSYSSTSTSSSLSSRYHRGRQGQGQARLDETSSTMAEYEEVLSAEVWIDIPKLRRYASDGIPRELRGEVWLYLLGIRDADRSKEVSTQKQRTQDFEQMDKTPNESTKRVRGEISRYLRKINLESDRDLPRLFEEVISAYCNHNHQVEYYAAMVNLCAPFVYSVKRESDAYLCFERMMSILDEHFNDESINEAVAKFMTLFHTCIPDLYSFFEEEEVDIKEWAASALQFVLSRELTLENTLRLWDTYFAIPFEAADTWIDLHPYFCLAILKHLKEQFEDLEQSEIRTILMRLPPLDMEAVINEAFNIRYEILERQVSDDGFQ